YLMFFLALFSGIGTAAFHPQASAMISAASGHKKGFFQSIFVAAGNVGWSLTPLMVIPIVKTYGLEATPIFIIPGILVAILLWFTAPKAPVIKKSVSVPVWPVLRTAWLELAKVVLIVASRSLTYFGLISFFPLYLQTKDISIVNSGYLLFVMLFSGAIGGIFGGYLSDKFGRKTVIIGSLLLSTPFFFLFLYSGGLVKYFFLSLAGATLLASFSVTVVLAQEIISKNTAMASGLTLRLGICSSGIGLGLRGIILYHIRRDYAINLLRFFHLLSGSAPFSSK
ncbi:MAG: MFS transporter, partial [Deltaproteobacteria bacterium]|nr:MFS transporter [Deltaproteobacteria bacterium]